MKRKKILFLIALAICGIILIIIGLNILFNCVSISNELVINKIITNSTIDIVMYVLIIGCLNIGIGLLVLTISSLKLVDFVY
jgi:hypothetical protein